MWIIIFWWWNKEKIVSELYENKLETRYRNSIPEQYIPANIENAIWWGWFNYYNNLINLWKEVFPILTLWDDKDWIELINQIKSKINNIWLKNLIEPIKWLKTPDSLIIAHNWVEWWRTILGSSWDDIYLYTTYAKNIINKIINDWLDLSSIMISHIRSDNKSIIKNKKLTTQKIIELFWNNDSLIYSNLWWSQLEYWYEYWKNRWINNIDFQQLNWEEVKFFFWVKNLFEAISIIKNEKLNFIITLWKKWVIYCDSNKVDEIIYIEQNYELNNNKQYNDELDLWKNIIDWTWAWDAFASGVVYKLDWNKNFSEDNILEAIQFWMTSLIYACSYIWGSTKTPNLKEHNKFHNIYKKNYKIYKINISNKNEINNLDEK